ncbi:MAG: glycoside hydrolase family 9 protein [Candidatus Paceibacterota bacterium]|jgi:hypothetical protein
MSNKKKYWWVAVIIFLLVFLCWAFCFNTAAFSNISQRLVASVVNVFDEPTTTISGTNVSLINDSNLAFQGNSAVKFSFPDKWHPTAVLGFTLATLTDPQDTLNFYIRTVGGVYSDQVYLTLKYSGATDQSQQIDLRPYLMGNQVTENYQLVTIPRSAFQGNFIGKIRQLSIQVPNDKTPLAFYVDKIFLDLVDQDLVNIINTGTSTGTTTATTTTTGTAKVMIFDDFAGYGMKIIGDNSLARTGSWFFEASFFELSSSQNRIRLDFPTYVMAENSSIDFYIRTKEGTYNGPLYMRVYYTGLTNQSQPIDIRSYLAAGKVTETYQRVSIPRSDIAGHFVGRFRHFYLSVPEDQNPGSFYLDDLNFWTESTNINDVDLTSTVVDPIVVKKEITGITDIAKNIFFDESDITGNGSKMVTDPVLAVRGSKLVKMGVVSFWSPSTAISGPTVSFSVPGSDTLSFFIRTATSSPATYDKSLYLSLDWSGNPDKSQNIDLKPYLTGGIVTATWQRVVIPRNAIAGNFNGSFRHFMLKTDAIDGKSKPAFFIDAVTLETTKGVVLESIVEVLDSRHLMMTLDKALDMNKSRDASLYEVIQADVQKKLAVSQVSFRSFVEDFSTSSSLSPIIKHYIYLTLAEPLLSGKSYSLIANVVAKEGAAPLKNNISFIIDFEKNVSSTIKVNQVGYLPDSPKMAYVGNYLGDGGPMTLAPGLVGYVKNASTDAIVYQAPLQHGTGIEMYKANTPWSGEDVWKLNFETFQTPGDYYVYVPGIGRSYTFKIANDVYDSVFFKTARSLMYQRSDINLNTTVAGKWARNSNPKTGADDKPLVGYFHNSIKDLSSAMWSPSEAIGSYKDMTGGWYDAADYSHYVRTAAWAVNFMLTMFEVAPDHFTDNQLNLPESGNGVPDFLDEVKWETDWLAKMVSTNGCVPIVLAYDHWPSTMPKDDAGKMWAITKNTIATAQTVGALAQASRVLAPYLPDTAQLYKEKALLAQSCLDRFPTTYPVIKSADGEKYCKPAGDKTLGTPNLYSNGCYFDVGYQNKNELDSRAKANIEMFRLTGEKKYNDAFKALVPTTKMRAWILDQYYIGSVNPMNAYSYYLEPKADPVWKTAIKNGLMTVANTYTNQNRWIYSTPLHDGIGFGTLTTPVYSYNYVLAYLVSGDHGYLDKAKNALDFQLGVNPLNKSFVTGVGSDSPMKPISNLSDYDGIIEPVPGYVIYGPAGDLPYKGSYAPVIDYTYPPFRASTTRPDLMTYPLVRKYVDSRNLTKFGEYTITDLATEAAIFGYFSKP